MFHIRLSHCFPFGFFLFLTSVTHCHLEFKHNISNGLPATCFLYLHLVVPFPLDFKYGTSNLHIEITSQQLHFPYLPLVAITIEFKSGISNLFLPPPFQLLLLPSSTSVLLLALLTPHCSPTPKHLCLEHTCFSSESHMHNISVQIWTSPSLLNNFSKIGK